jgi:general secretion pathway protein K
MKRRQGGAAIVMAMVVVAVTATLVAGAHWRQSIVLRQAENELAYAQAKWLIRGAIDWAGLILREDARISGVDHLGEPWAVPLADTHLNQGDGRDPVYLAGQMRDEQARFNLRNLADAKGVNPAELEVLRRLLELVGASAGAAEAIAQRVTAPDMVPLIAIDDLAGLDAEVVERLRPFVTVLPQRTAINANTAPAEVLAARLDLGLADARRLVASRAGAYFNNRADVLARIPELKLQATDADIAVGTQFFSVEGIVSYRRARLHTRALLRREPNRVETIWMREAA